MLANFVGIARISEKNYFKKIFLMVVRILNFQNYKRQMPIVFAFGERHPAKFHFDRFTHCTET